MNEFPWRPGLPRRRQPERSAKIPLTREEIVAVALRIVQAEGIEAVSMRRVASEFSTGPSSLYAHVAHKDELLQLMFDQMCGLVAIPTLDPPRWKDQVKQLARAGYQAMIEHNDLAKAALGTIPSGPNTLRISEAMLGMLLAGGIPSRVAGWTLDRLFLYIVADAYEYSIWRAMVKATGAAKQEVLTQLADDLAAYYGDLPADEFPQLRRHGADLAAGSPEDRFEFGLDLLLDGLDRYVTTPTPSE